MSEGVGGVEAPKAIRMCLLECVDEVFSIVSTNIFDAKIINH